MINAWKQSAVILRNHYVPLSLTSGLRVWIILGLCPARLIGGKGGSSQMCTTMAGCLSDGGCISCDIPVNRKQGIFSMPVNRIQKNYSIPVKRTWSLTVWTLVCCLYLNAGYRKLTVCLWTGQGTCQSN